MGRNGQIGTRRADFLRGAAAAGSGLALAGLGVEGAQAAGKKDVTQEARRILGVLLVLERLTTTLYYGGLTSYFVMRSADLAGPGGNPHNPGLPPGGNPQQVRFLQAALDAEAKHAAALERVGAASPYARFYFPYDTLQRLGSPASRASFLGVVDMLETVCVGAYGAAAIAFIRLGRPDLAETSARIMGVESEHRTLGRVIGRITPANDHTLETAPFGAVDEAMREIAPFLTGRDYLFANGASAATRIATMPASGEVARVVGAHGTRLVPSFALPLAPKRGRRRAPIKGGH